MAAADRLGDGSALAYIPAGAVHSIRAVVVLKAATTELTLEGAADLRTRVYGTPDVAAGLTAAMARPLRS
jgi:hypothetical protein